MVLILVYWGGNRRSINQTINRLIGLYIELSLNSHCLSTERESFSRVEANRFNTRPLQSAYYVPGTITILRWSSKYNPLWERREWRLRASLGKAQIWTPLWFQSPSSFLFLPLLLKAVWEVPKIVLPSPRNSSFDTTYSQIIWRYYNTSFYLLNIYLLSNDN